MSKIVTIWEAIAVISMAMFIGYYIGINLMKRKVTKFFKTLIEHKEKKDKQKQTFSNN